MDKLTWDLHQICKFQNKSLLKFFLSEEIDIDKFKATKHVKILSPIGLPKILADMTRTPLKHA